MTTSFLDLADPDAVLDPQTLAAWRTRTAEADVPALVDAAAAGDPRWWDDVPAPTAAALDALVPGDDPVADALSQAALRFGYRTARSILGPLPPCREPSTNELLDVLGGLDAVAVALAVPDVGAALGPPLEAAVADAVEDHRVGAYLDVARIAADLGIALAVVEQDRCTRTP